MENALVLRHLTPPKTNAAVAPCPKRDGATPVSSAPKSMMVLFYYTYLFCINSTNLPEALTHVIYFSFIAGFQNLCPFGFGIIPGIGDTIIGKELTLSGD